MQEQQAVRNIDLQMVADHRETVMDISMGCIEHETRILKKARVSPLEKGLRLFLIVYLQIESFYPLLLYLTHLTISFCPGTSSYMLRSGHLMGKEGLIIY